MRFVKFYTIFPENTPYYAVESTQAKCYANKNYRYYRNSMTGSVFTKPSFQPFKMIVLLVIASAWLYGWAYTDTIRALWDHADRAVFFTLNGSLVGHPLWQNVWAIGNNISIDIVMGLCIVSLFYLYAASENAAFALERICIFLLMCTMAVTAKLCMRFLSDNERFSASAELEPALHLSEYVTWLKTKDLSNDSFPSDHGTLLMLAVAFLWFFAGKRYGRPMLLLAILFCLPRLFSGAHWFTDMAVGSFTVTLVVSALTLCTPLYQLLISAYLAILDRPLFTRFLPLFFPQLKRQLTVSSNG